MTDRTLRELEQRAATDPRANLELATALERVGRPGAALEALWRGCDDLEVRRAAARFDVDRGPVRAATVAWTRKVGGRDRLECLDAGPLALTMRSPQRTLLLDPRTGETRRELPPATSLWNALGAVVVQGRDGAYTAIDAWTGEQLWSTRLHAGEAHASGETFVDVRRADGELIAFRSDGLRSTPTIAWRRRSKDLSSVAVRQAYVLVSERDALIVLDPRTGEERLRLGGVERFEAQRGGILVTMSDDDDVPWEAFDPLGRRLGTLPDGETVGPIASPVVVSRLAPGRKRLQRWDVATGRFVGPRVDVKAYSVVEVIDDVALLDPAPSEYVAAVSLDDGRELWRWSSVKPPTPERSLQLATLPGRVYVSPSPRELTCLVDA
jgi:hypothetical protein